MHLLIDIGNSTIVMALADAQGNITATWRFKTKKDETASLLPISS
jgi:pantothenate kinase (EC 2.7.1.33)